MWGHFALCSMPDIGPSCCLLHIWLCCMSCSSCASLGTCKLHDVWCSGRPGLAGSQLMERSGSSSHQEHYLYLYLEMKISSVFNGNFYLFSKAFNLLWIFLSLFDRWHGSFLQYFGESDLEDSPWIAMGIGKYYGLLMHKSWMDVRLNIQEGMTGLYLFFSPISSSTYPWVRSDLFIFFTFLMKESFLQRNTEAFLIRCMFIHFDSFLLSFISVACSLQCQICFSRWWCCIAIGSTCLQGNMTAHYTEGWPLKGKR